MVYGISGGHTEAFADNETSTHQTAHDSTDGYIENRRGFAIAQSLDGHQQHHAALRVGQSLDRADDLLVQGMRLRIAGPGVCNSFHELLAPLHVAVAANLSCAQLVEPH